MADTLLPIPQVPEGLREAAQRGILIPFIGAGVSRLAGCPDWAQFADGALKWLINNGKFSYAQLDQIGHLNPRVKLSLARGLERDNGVSIDFQKLLHPTSRGENAMGIRLYNSLFKLGKTFVTTNYDEWLDERVPQASLSAVPAAEPKDVSVVASMRVVYKVEDLLPALLSDPNTVIHLHGSLRDPAGMILTFLDYLFTNKAVLFIGYGLDELEILEYVILKARRPSPPRPKETKHYIIQGFFSHQRELLRGLQSYYLDCGIHLIPFLRDNKNWEQLLEVLEDFALRVPASEPLVLQKAQEMENLLNG